MCASLKNTIPKHVGSTSSLLIHFWYNEMKRKAQKKIEFWLEVIYALRCNLIKKLRSYSIEIISSGICLMAWSGSLVKPSLILWSSKTHCGAKFEPKHVKRTQIKSNCSELQYLVRQTGESLGCRSQRRASWTLRWNPTYFTPLISMHTCGTAQASPAWAFSLKLLPASEIRPKRLAYF